MIAKRIPAPKGAGGFTQLGAYVLDVKQRRRPGELGTVERLRAGRRP